MKKKSMIFLVAVILMLGMSVGLMGVWRECQFFGCGYAGAACEDGGWKMAGCSWILCYKGGSIACPELP
jgi:hypothetical protein